MTINLRDARKGLHQKCFELFTNKHIAEHVYRYLCDGIEECEEVEPIKHGRWEESWGGKWHSCSICGGIPPFNMRGDDMPTPYCPHCGAKMDLDEVKERVTKI